MIKDTLDIKRLPPPPTNSEQATKKIKNRNKNTIWKD